MRNVIPAILGLAMTFLFNSGVAARELSGEMKLTTRRVTVFKDGHGLFVKTAVAEESAEGTVFTEEVPDAASLGSFWVSDRKEDIAALVASRMEKKTRDRYLVDCQSVFEILKANRGKEARVKLADGTIYGGQIHAVLERPAETGKEKISYRHLSFVADSRSPAAPEVMELASSGSHFVLRTKDGDLLLPVAKVESVRLPEMVYRIERERTTTEQVKHLTVRYQKKNPGKQHTLDLLYFRSGIRWIPTYRIELGQDGKAELVLQAEVLNEAEDIIDTPVDFVVGVPTFRFKDLISPLALEQVMIQTLTMAAPGLMTQLGNQNWSNAQFHSRAGERHRPAVPAVPTGPDLAVTAMRGQEVQDLFYYSTKRLTLRRGERAAVELLRAKVPYRHQYTWDADLGDPRYRGSVSAGSPLVIAKNEVWHQVILKNTTGCPWTTGPAMLLEAGLPLGQDLMTFTPKGTEVMIPVTQAVSVRGTVKEVELGRNHGAKKIRSTTYTRVRNRATFEIANNSGREVHLVIKAKMQGRSTSASRKGKIEHLGLGPGRGILNLQSEVTWEMDLKPKASREVQAVYHYYQTE